MLVEFHPLEAMLMIFLELSSHPANTLKNQKHFGTKVTGTLPKENGTTHSRRKMPADKFVDGIGEDYFTLLQIFFNTRFFSMINQGSEHLKFLKHRKGDLRKSQPLGKIEAMSANLCCLKASICIGSKRIVIKINSTKDCA